MPLLSPHGDHVGMKTGAGAGGNGVLPKTGRTMTNRVPSRRWNHPTPEDLHMNTPSLSPKMGGRRGRELVRRQRSHLEMEQSLQELECDFNDELEASDLLEPFPDKLRSESAEFQLEEEEKEQEKEQQQQQQAGSKNQSIQGKNGMTMTQDQQVETPSKRQNCKKNILKAVFQRGMRNRRREGGIEGGGSSQSLNYNSRYPTDAASTPTSSLVSFDTGSDELLVEFDHTKSREGYRKARDGDDQDQKIELGESYRFDFESEFVEPLKKFDDEDEDYYYYDDGDGNEVNAQDNSGEEGQAGRDFDDDDRHSDCQNNNGDDSQEEDEEMDRSYRSRTLKKPGQIVSEHSWRQSARTSRHKQKTRYRRYRSMDDFDRSKERKSNSTRSSANRYDKQNLRRNSSWHDRGSSPTRRVKSDDENELIESSRKIDGVFDDDDFKALLGEFEKQVQDDLQERRSRTPDPNNRRRKDEDGNRSRRSRSPDNFDRDRVSGRDDRRTERSRRRRSHNRDSLDHEDTKSRNSRRVENRQRSQSSDNVGKEHAGEKDEHRTERRQRSRSADNVVEDYSSDDSDRRTERWRRSRSTDNFDRESGVGVGDSRLSRNSQRGGSENLEGLSAWRRDLRTRSRSLDQLDDEHDRGTAERKERSKGFDNLDAAKSDRSRRNNGGDSRRLRVRSKSTDRLLCDDKKDCRQERDRSEKCGERRISKRTISRRDEGERNSTRASSHSRDDCMRRPRRVEETNLSRAKSDDGVTLNFPSRRSRDVDVTRLERATSDDGLMLRKSKKNSGSSRHTRASSADGMPESRRSNKSERIQQHSISIDDPLSGTSAASDTEDNHRRLSTDHERNKSSRRQRIDERSQRRTPDEKERDRSTRRM